MAVTCRSGVSRRSGKAPGASRSSAACSARSRPERVARSPVAAGSRSGMGPDSTSREGGRSSGESLGACMFKPLMRSSRNVIRANATLTQPRKRSVAGKRSPKRVAIVLRAIVRAREKDFADLESPIASGKRRGGRDDRQSTSPREYFPRDDGFFLYASRIGCYSVQPVNVFKVEEV